MPEENKQPTEDSREEIIRKIENLEIPIPEGFNYVHEFHRPYGGSWSDKTYLNIKPEIEEEN